MPLFVVQLRISHCACSGNQFKCAARVVRGPSWREFRVAQPRSRLGWAGLAPRLLYIMSPHNLGTGLGGYTVSCNVSEYQNERTPGPGASVGLGHHPNGGVNSYSRCMVGQTARRVDGIAINSTVYVAPYDASPASQNSRRDDSRYGCSHQLGYFCLFTYGMHCITTSGKRNYFSYAVSRTLLSTSSPANPSLLV